MMRMEAIRAFHSSDKSQIYRTKKMRIYSTNEIE